MSGSSRPRRHRAGRWCGSNDKPGTAEQSIKEGKQAVKMTQPSCYRFRSNEGLATAALTVQATVSGLVVHEMAGFDVEKARCEFSIPPDHQPVVVAAIGYPGSPGQASGETTQ
ncbi:MAG TPA: hypothetical protein VIH75_23060 [Candidatus Sulfotelmatobacter sp.]